MEIVIRNEKLILDFDRAIYLPDYSILVISDLHLGKSAHFRKSGIQIPKTLHINDLHRLTKLIDKYKPLKIIINGDMFHSNLNSEIEEFKVWKSNFSEIEFILVIGNHDKLKIRDYANLNLKIYTEQFILNNLSFTHQKSDVETENYLITGHVHPGISIVGKAKQRLKFPCFYFSDTYAIMPAFSEFTGLYNIYPNKNDRTFAIVKDKIIEF
jgi:DNA ligase-associated metallophosphoesterase